MKVWIDGCETVLHAYHANLQDVLQEIIDLQIEKNRVIWSVKVNGEAFGEKVPHEASQMDLADIQTLEVETMSAEEICETFLRNSGSILDCLSESADRLHFMFRTSNHQEANRQYWNLMESCQGFFAMLHESEAVLKLDFQNVQLKSASLRNTLRNSSHLFDSMLTAQEHQDWKNLADLLEHDLSPLLLEYKEIMTARAA